MRTYYKLIILQIFLGWIPFLYGQDFCKLNFGMNWVTFLSYPLRPEKYMDYDTLKFTKSKFVEVDHQYLELYCHDSTFSIVYVSTDTSSDGTIVSWKGYSNIGKGKWRLDTIKHLITFRLNEYDTLYTFEYVFSGNKQTKKHVVLTSDYDYRTQLLLIRKEW